MSSGLFGHCTKCGGSWRETDESDLTRLHYCAILSILLLLLLFYPPVALVLATCCGCCCCCFCFGRGLESYDGDRPIDALRGCGATVLVILLPWLVCLPSGASEWLGNNRPNFVVNWGENAGSDWVRAADIPIHEIKTENSPADETDVEMGDVSGSSE